MILNNQGYTGRHLNKQYTQLKEKKSLNGILYPIDQNDILIHKTRIGILTDDDREFFVLCSTYWDSILWGFKWSNVKLNGIVNYNEGSIEVQSFYLNKLDPNIMSDIDFHDDIQYY
jgi:hypothetical protein